MAATHELRPDTQFVALSTVTAWVLWQNKRPIDYRLRVTGEQFPEREQLGHLDQKQWELRPDGTRADPWVLTKHVYLADVRGGELFTFVTSSVGGHGAIADLADQVKWMRSVRPGAMPVIELSSIPMTTKHGKRMRPLLRVVGLRGGGGEQLEPPKAAEMIDDEVPF